MSVKEVPAKVSVVLVDPAILREVVLDEVMDKAAAGVLALKVIILPEVGLALN